jgi:hypothetical protein
MGIVSLGAMFGERFVSRGLRAWRALLAVGWCADHESVVFPGDGWAPGRDSIGWCAVLPQRVRDA